MQSDIHISHSRNPYLNLALEDWLFRHSELCHGPKLLLWRNDPSIILGRFQNPWKECRVMELRSRDTLLVRRQSGGGTVYHDLGNLNFSFMAQRQDYNKDVIHGIIIQALQELGVTIRKNHRHDLVIDSLGEEYKISGSAFKENRDRCFHHGTLLIEADLEVLNYLLRPKKRQLNCVAVNSHPSRVMNINDIQSLSYQQIRDKIAQQYRQHFSSQEGRQEWTEGNMRDHLGIQESYKRFSSKEWIWEETPKFREYWHQELSFGEVSLHLESKSGHITSAKLECSQIEAHDLTYWQEDLQKSSYGNLQIRPELVDLKPELFDWLKLTIC